MEIDADVVQLLPELLGWKSDLGTLFGLYSREFLAKLPIVK